MLPNSVETLTSQSRYFTLDRPQFRPRLLPPATARERSRGQRGHIPVRLCAPNRRRPECPADRSSPTRVRHGPQIRKPPCSSPLTAPTLFMVYCPSEVTTLVKSAGLEAAWPGALAPSPSGWASPGRLSQQFLSLPGNPVAGSGRERGTAGRAFWQSPKTW